MLSELFADRRVDLEAMQARMKKLMDSALPSASEFHRMRRRPS